MNKKTIAAAVCLVAIGLTACDQHDRMEANSAICPDFKAANTVAPVTGDAASPVDECVRRWAYSLASSRDDAEVVASAAVAACGTLLSRWNQQSIAQAPDATVQPLSLITGEPTNPLAEHNTFAQNRALLYVVQARAGRCKAPPVTNGVPAGIPG
jgi:hypothetical protein